MRLLFFLLLCTCGLDLFAQGNQELYENIEKKISEERYTDALVIIDKKLQEFPNDALLYELKASATDMRGNRVEALNILKDAVEKFPQNKNLLVYLGVMQSNSGYMEEAENTYLKLLLLSSTAMDSIVVFVNMAAMYNLKQDYESCIKISHLANSMSDTIFGIKNNLGLAYLYCKKYDSAVYYLEKAMQLDSSIYENYNNLGFVLGETGAYEKALNLFDAAIVKFPKRAYIYSNKGHILNLLHRNNEAIKFINKSIELDNHNPYAYRNRALVYIDMNLIREACMDLEASKKLGFKTFYGNEVEELQERYCKEK